MFQKILLAVGVLLINLIVTGCSVLPPQPDFLPPTIPPDVPPPPKKGGTIYQPGYEVALYSDNVAHRIGDILTVRLEEKTEGRYKAKTKTDKKAQLDYPLPILFGKPEPSLVVKTKTEQIFDATGDSDQSNNLKGTLSVTVTRVLSNHNLVVQGESWVTINQGQEYLQLSGIVRVTDIEPNNTVSSQRIAAAQIKYGARGQAGYATQGGLMTRLFNRFAPY